MTVQNFYTGQQRASDFAERSATIAATRANFRTSVCPLCDGSPSLLSRAVSVGGNCVAYYAQNLAAPSLKERTRGIQFLWTTFAEFCLA